MTLWTRMSSLGFRLSLKNKEDLVTNDNNLQTSHGKLQVAKGYCNNFFKVALCINLIHRGRND